MRAFKPSFTILELLIVIIIIGILAYSINFKFFNTNLQVAADSLIKNIHYTQSLALKDDKYQPFPNHVCDGSDEGKVECNRSKYWFKQWWQIRFSTFKDSNNVVHYWYEIFSDLPDASVNDNFDKLGKDPSDKRDISLAKNPLTNKLMIGHCDENGVNFPKCNLIDPKLDLTQAFNVVKVEFSSNFSRSKRLLFDNFGNVFLKESNSTSDRNGDVGDTNPLDVNARKLLTSNVYIRLCSKTDSSNNCLKDKDYCVQVNITPTGYVFKSTCN